ncbi:hypothetical protein, partial [Mycobacterium tuberculosis]
MDSHKVCMNNNTQLPTGPIIGVHPAVRDGVERVAYLDGDLLRCNTDVEFTSSPPPGPVLYLNRPGMSGDSSSWKGWGH